MKLIKFHTISDCNEFRTISGKWKFCQINSLWILVEHTSLSMVVYMPFLYTQTNHKKRHDQNSIAM